MPEVRVVERTFAFGQNRYRAGADGNWQSLHWGWFPTGQNPRWEWVAIPRAGVPVEVLRRANLP